MTENSFYGVVYRGGIALAMGLENVAFLMQRNDDIELLERFKPEEAYIWATQKYVDRKNQLQRYTMPMIPNMEDLMYKAYHEPNFVESVPTNRFFAMIAATHVGIFTSVESAIEFLERVFTVKKWYTKQHYERKI